MKCCEYVHLGPCCWDNLFSRVKWQWHICTTTDNYTAIHFQVSALFIQGFTLPSQMKAAGNCSELKKIQAPHDLGVRYLICLATYLYSNRIKKINQENNFQLHKYKKWTVSINSQLQNILTIAYRPVSFSVPKWTFVFPEQSISLTA